MTLTAELFQPVGGELYAHLHENTLTGFPRGLYWSATVRFAPFVVDTELFEATASIDWLNFRERIITGHQLATPANQTQGEASLYTFMHQASDDWQCTIDFTGPDQLYPGRRIKFDYAMTVEAYAFEPGLILALQGSTALTFGGIILVKDNLPEKPGSEPAARALIEPYYDLSTYQCDESDWQFIFHQRSASR